MKWERDEKHKEGKALEDILQKMKILQAANLAGSLNDHQFISLQNLEQLRLGLLNKEEAKWHLKIRAIWLSLGDQNNKFFHKYADYRRISNSIWSLNGPDGEIISSQQDLSVASINHFHSYYDEGQQGSIHDQLKIIK